MSERRAGLWVDANDVLHLTDYTEIYPARPPTIGWQFLGVVLLTTTGEAQPDAEALREAEARFQEDFEARGGGAIGAGG